MNELRSYCHASKQVFAAFFNTQVRSMTAYLGERKKKTNVFLHIYAMHRCYTTKTVIWNVTNWPHAAKYVCVYGRHPERQRICVSIITCRFVHALCGVRQPIHYFFLFLLSRYEIIVYLCPIRIRYRHTVYGISYTCRSGKQYLPTC